MKYAIEQHLKMLEYWSIQKMMMEELPVAVYWIGQDEKLKYCNSNAKKRLEAGKTLRIFSLIMSIFPLKSFAGHAYAPPRNYLDYAGPHL